MQTKKEMGKERSGWIDIAKGIGIIIIVLGHCCIQDHQIPFHDYLFSFNTVLFFTLSGMTFCREKNNTERSAAVWAFDNRKTAEFLRKLFRTIVVPYLCWALISIGIFLLMGRLGLAAGEGISFRLRTNLLGMFYANSEWGQMMWNRPLWFLPCLAVLEILGFLLLKGCTQIAQRKGKKAGEIVWPAAGLCGGIWIILEGFCGLDPQLPWEAETAAGMLFFFCLGRVWMRMFERIEESGKATGRFRGAAGAVGTLLLLLNILQVRMNGTTDTRADLFRNPLLYLAGALLGTMGILLLSYAWKHAVRMEKIGRSSLAILVMHKFPLQAADVLASRLQIPKGYPLSAVTCIGSILLCLAAEPLVRMILPEALGKYRADKISE